MAKVVGIIGARLNSSRLPGKHLLDLAGQPLIARIFQRLERVGEIDKLVLATTADDYNRPLVEWANANGKAVFAFAGDVNDLVGRVDAVVAAEQPDVVLYFCGDSPLMEPATIAAMVRVALTDPTAERIELTPPPRGNYIHEGWAVYPRAVWDRIVAASTGADDREHVGSVLRRIGQAMVVRQIPEDPVFARVEHRISVDTPSDYAFMGQVYQRWYQRHGADTIVSLRWVIAELERDAALAAINAQVRQKAVGEHSDPVLLVCHAGTGIGLGHLSRVMAVARALQDRHFAAVHLLIQGEPLAKAGLSILPHRFIPAAADLMAALADEVAATKARALVLDLHPAHIPPDLADFLAGHAGLVRVGIDSTWSLAAALDVVCLPGFAVPAAILRACQPVPVLHGWPHYLLQASARKSPWQPGRSLLVLTGGSDTTGLGRTLPRQLDAALPPGLDIHWVQGPYAGAPILPEAPRQNWQVHHAPDDLAALMESCHYALTIYGVSVFELLARGVPTVVFSPYGGRDDAELAALADEQVVRIEADADAAARGVAALMADAAGAARLAAAGPAKVDGLGPARLADFIYKVLASRS